MVYAIHYKQHSTNTICNVNQFRLEQHTHTHSRVIPRQWLRNLNRSTYAGVTPENLYPPQYIVLYQKIATLLKLSWKTVTQHTVLMKLLNFFCIQRCQTSFHCIRGPWTAHKRNRQGNHTDPHRQQHWWIEQQQIQSAAILTKRLSI